jgi:hypothetical protein
MEVLLGVVEVLDMGCPELLAVDNAFEPLDVGVVVQQRGHGMVVHQVCSPS